MKTQRKKSNEYSRRRIASDCLRLWTLAAPEERERSFLKHLKGVLLPKYRKLEFLPQFRCVFSCV